MINVRTVKSSNVIGHLPWLLLLQKMKSISQTRSTNKFYCMQKKSNQLFKFFAFVSFIFFRCCWCCSCCFHTQWYSQIGCFAWIFKRSFGSRLIHFHSFINFMIWSLCMFELQSFLSRSLSLPLRWVIELRGMLWERKAQTSVRDAKSITTSVLLCRNCTKLSLFRQSA